MRRHRRQQAVLSQFKDHSADYTLQVMAMLRHGFPSLRDYWEEVAQEAQERTLRVWLAGRSREVSTTAQFPGAVVTNVNAHSWRPGRSPGLTWISDSSAPHESEPRFEDGWDEGVRTGPAAGAEVPELGHERGAGLDLVRCPAGEIEQQAVQRAGDQFGVVPAELGAGLRIVVVLSVDSAAQRLLNPCPILPAATDNAGLAMVALGLPASPTGGLPRSGSPAREPAAGLLLGLLDEPMTTEPDPPADASLVSAG